MTRDYPALPISQPAKNLASATTEANENSDRPRASRSAAPMRSFIWKVASRCNLDCDYCYVYKHADQSWRDQPIRASVEVAAQLGKRIREHATLHGLTEVDVILHGGEPLSIGVPHLDALCDALEASAAGIGIRWRIQTNGALLGDQEFEFCLRRSVTVGLSMDGPRAANDRHRLDFQGKSSFDAVEAALRRLSTPEGRRVWSGFLCVIDLASDPLEVYRYFRSWQPRTIEFLLPLAHHDMQPPGKVKALGGTPYADWLLAIYREWMEERPQPISIRRFRDIIALLAGAHTSSEEWGLQPVDFAVIEANGEIQAVDTLKVCYPGANHLGLNIFTSSIDAMYTAPAVLERQNRWSTLAAVCQTCPVVQVCGGGYFPHRYSRARAFDNPSVYCQDLLKMIQEIHRDVSSRLARRHIVAEA